MVCLISYSTSWRGSYKSHLQNFPFFRVTSHLRHGYGVVPTHKNLYHHISDRDMAFLLLTKIYTVTFPTHKRRIFYTHKSIRSHFQHNIRTHASTSVKPHAHRLPVFTLLIVLLHYFFILESSDEGGNEQHSFDTTDEEFPSELRCSICLRRRERTVALLSCRHTASC